MKNVVIIFTTFFIGLFAFAYFSFRSDEQALKAGSRHELEIALKDLQETGNVHDHTSMLGTNIIVISHPFLFTNMVLINGTNYRCAVAIDDIWMRRMAATTNGVFIFFDKNGGPQLISSK